MKSNTVIFSALACVLVGSVFLLGQQAQQPSEISALQQQIADLLTRVEKLENLMQAQAVHLPSLPAGGLPEGARVQGEINGMKYYLVPLQEDPQ